MTTGKKMYKGMWRYNVIGAVSNSVIKEDSSEEMVFE